MGHVVGPGGLGAVQYYLNSFLKFYTIYKYWDSEDGLYQNGKRITRKSQHFFLLEKNIQTKSVDLKIQVSQCVQQIIMKNARDKFFYKLLMWRVVIGKQKNDISGRSK